jgi:hypothetical protein
MKKLLTILCACVCAGAHTQKSTEYQQPTDLNRDGLMDIVDTRLALDAAGAFAMTDHAYHVALDTNADSIVSVAEVRAAFPSITTSDFVTAAVYNIDVRYDDDTCPELLPQVRQLACTAALDPAHASVYLAVHVHITTAECESALEKTGEIQ